MEQLCGTTPNKAVSQASYVVSDRLLPMGDPNSWYDREKFRGLFEPILFDEQRQSDVKVEFEDIMDLLKIQQDERILDFYRGTGRQSLAAAEKGFSVVGVDRTVSVT